MKIFSNIIKYILVIVLAISIIALVFIHIASSTILNKQYTFSRLQETNYYEQINKQIKSNLENYIHQSGLEEKVLENIIPEEKVKKDVNIIVKNIYDGTNEKIDVTEIRNNLNKNIEESISNKKLTITQQESIKEFVNKICDEYTSTMTHTNYEQNINNAYMKILKYSQLAQKITLVTILISIIIILGLSYKTIFKGISKVGIAITSSGVFYIFINIFITSKVRIETITILNNSITVTLRNVLTNIMQEIAKYGYILLVIGLAVIIIGCLTNSIKDKDKITIKTD